MNGAQSLVKSLLNSGVDTCFANPGTSEMHFVAALDKIPGMRCVLGLQENVVTGMADGYARIAGKPAVTLLHCGPGLGNGLANLHNARRAKSPVVNIVGDQASYHRPHDPPLTTDTLGLARTVSAWTRVTTQSKHVGRDGARAVQAARMLPGQVATLILPSDASWNEGGVVAAPEPLWPPAPQDPHAVKLAEKLLRSGKKVLILLGGRAMLEPSQLQAWRIAESSGATVMFEYVAGHVERGAGRAPFKRVPYVLSEARKALATFDVIILVGAQPPVAFFAYPGQPNVEYREDVVLHYLSHEDQDPEVALQALADSMHAPKVAFPDPGPRPDAPVGVVSPEGVALALAALMPEDAIISEEGVSYTRGLYENTFAAPAHDMLHLPGGAIGDGLPVSAGAAVAGGDRRVIDLQADGSAMYTVQSLWTMAREKLPVTVIILSNRKYRILMNEYANVGAEMGQTASDMLDLGNPDLDWPVIAAGMGVEAAKAETLEQLCDLMAASFMMSGPFLIELMI